MIEVSLTGRPISHASWWGIMTGSQRCLCFLSVRSSIFGKVVSKSISQDTGLIWCYCYCSTTIKPNVAYLSTKCSLSLWLSTSAILQKVYTDFLKTGQVSDVSTHVFGQRHWPVKWTHKNQTAWRNCEQSTLGTLLLWVICTVTHQINAFGGQ